MKTTGRGWWLMVVLAALTAAYGFATALIGPPIYSPDLKASFVARPWGIYPHAFFGGLAVALLATTGLAFRAIKGRDVATHREWMIRSYALIFAAVMLRIEIPLLMIATQGNFDVTYRIVAWLCWVPNLVAAEWIVRRTRPTAAAGLPAF